MSKFIPQQNKNQNKARRQTIVIVVDGDFLWRVKTAARGQGLTISGIVKQMIEHCLADMAS